MCADSASPESDRGLRYKALSLAFSYPDEKVRQHFAAVLSPEEAEELPAEYDRLFRASGVWLYGAEHTAANAHEKARTLADIMAFYRAAGLEPVDDRPDELSRELEFMHYLVFKEQRSRRADRQARAKTRTCRQMQKKFLLEHLLPAGCKIAQAVRAQTRHAFYGWAAEALDRFLASEARLLARA